MAFQPPQRVEYSYPCFHNLSSHASTRLHMRVCDLSVDHYNTESRKNSEKEKSPPFDFQGIREHHFDSPNLLIFFATISPQIV